MNKNSKQIVQTVTSLESNLQYQVQPPSQVKSCMMKIQNLLWIQNFSALTNHSINLNNNRKLAQKHREIKIWIKK